MSTDKKIEILKGRERDIMLVFWDMGISLLASDIIKIDRKLSINTVQANLRKLMGKGFIEVENIVYSGTVLSRKYKPCISKEEYIEREISNYFKELDISSAEVVLALIEKEGNEKKVINELEALLAQRKKVLKGE